MAIGGISVTNDNYLMVVKLLKKKFVSQQAIVEALYFQLHYLLVAINRFTETYVPTYKVIKIILRQLYCTLHRKIKETKCALFFIKCKDAVWKKNTVMKLTCYCFCSIAHSRR